MQDIVVDSEGFQLLGDLVCFAQKAKETLRRETWTLGDKLSKANQRIKQLETENAQYDLTLKKLKDERQRAAELEKDILKLNELLDIRERCVDEQREKLARSKKLYEQISNQMIALKKQISVSRTRLHNRHELESFTSRIDQVIDSANSAARKTTNLEQPRSNQQICNVDPLSLINRGNAFDHDSMRLYSRKSGTRIPSRPIDQRTADMIEEKKDDENGEPDARTPGKAIAADVSFSSPSAVSPIIMLGALKSCTEKVGIEENMDQSVNPSQAASQSSPILANCDPTMFSIELFPSSEETIDRINKRHEKEKVTDHVSQSKTSQQKTRREEEKQAIGVFTSPEKGSTSEVCEPKPKRYKSSTVFGEQLETEEKPTSLIGFGSRSISLSRNTSASGRRMVCGEIMVQGSSTAPVKLKDAFAVPRHFQAGNKQVILFDKETSVNMPIILPG